MLPSYILIKTRSFIYQYDYDINDMISEFPITYIYSFLQKIYMIENNTKLVSFGNYSSYYTLEFQVLDVMAGYACVGCRSCRASYYLNGSNCMKITTLIPPNNTINQNNTTIPNNNTNSTLPLNTT